MYRLLTNDASQPSCETTAEVDRRVKLFLETEDPEIVIDLRSHNPGRPSTYEVYWVHVNTYIKNVTEIAVHERRHESVMYLATAMSARHLMEEVDKVCPPDVPRPSLNWLRLQFWPKSPTSQVAMQHTGRLNVKYQVQQRQLRQDHVDAHYASALFRYLREMAIMFKDHVSFVSQDDKHKVKCGEPGHPVAAAERGKQVLVAVGQSFQVSDHDFTRVTLTPSVNFLISVPDTIEGSFYQGKVFVGMKDSTFQPSSPLRHATELRTILHSSDPGKEIILIYSDEGPDHRVNFLQVQLSLVTLFLRGDYDSLVAVRTPPGHSWKNPAERIMSIINLGLQAVGVMRSQMPGEHEGLIGKCNNLKDVRTVGEKNPTKRTQTVWNSQSHSCQV